MQTLYGPQANPLATVLHGVPTLWDLSTAHARFPSKISAVGWSPCSKLFAVAWEAVGDVMPKIGVLDAVTLKQCYTVYLPDMRVSWSQVVFSSDSHLLAGYSYTHNCIVTWDLQTGGTISNISTAETTQCNSMSFSECGTMLGALFDRDAIIYNIPSSTQISSHPVQCLVVGAIWTCGEYLQFATTAGAPQSIFLWQVSFTSGQTPKKVGSLPTPNGFSSHGLIVLPALSQLAFISGDRVIVWDAQNHKALLDFGTDYEDPETISLASNGSFFICGMVGRGLYLWKKSPHGYLPHQKLLSGSIDSIPLVSPNGGSVFSFSGVMIKLWHTTGPSAPFFNDSRQTSHHYEDFIVDISPDESLVAVAGKLRHTFVVFAVKSGASQLDLDADTKICGLKITEDKIIVIGDGKIVTWDSPGRNGVFNANSTQTITFFAPGIFWDLYAAVSPDLNYLAIRSHTPLDWDLYIYDVHHGKFLAIAKSGAYMPGFTQDSSVVWCSRATGEVDQWVICKQDGSNAIKLEQLEGGRQPQGNFPWHSPHGFQVTDDGSVLSSSGKQLLWLPHHWRPGNKISQKWSEKLLVVWNNNLPEPVILKLEV